jgi:hypothetical protein
MDIAENGRKPPGVRGIIGQRVDREKGRGDALSRILAKVIRGRFSVVHIDDWRSLENAREFGHWDNSGALGQLMWRHDQKCPRKEPDGGSSKRSEL